MTHPLAYVNTDGNGRFLGMLVCSCEVGRPGFDPGPDWLPTDDTCPLYDRHLALLERIGQPLPAPRLEP
jgi:hypothetical protein